MKKYLSALLAVLMIVSVFSSGVSAYADNNPDYSLSDARDRYDSMSGAGESFDHVDVRVAGTVVIGGETKDVTVSNPKVTISIVSNNKEKTLYNITEFDESDSFEWRKTDLAVPTGAKVVLTCDLTVDGETISGKTFTFQGREAFAQAILDCDKHEGLDFTIKEAELQDVFQEEPQEEIYHQVSYQWTGLPEGLADLPAAGSFLNEAEVPVDPSFAEGSTRTDADGNVYTFSGWNTYEQGGVSVLLNGAASFAVTADTVIRGAWTMAEAPAEESVPASDPAPTKESIPSSEPEPSPEPSPDPEPTVGSLTVVKDFGTDSEIKADSENVGSFSFKVTDASGTVVKEIQFPIASSDTPREFTVEDLAAGTYTVTEDAQSAQREGYELAVNEAGTEDDAVVTEVIAGESAKATIINTYSKIEDGEPPIPASFKIRKTDESGKALSGAEFTLYDENGFTKTVTTDANGEAVFGGFTKAAQYTLKETKAPESYAATELTWTVTVSMKDGEPSIQISENGSFWSKMFNWAASTDAEDVDGLLTVTNTLKTGSLTITNTVENNKKLGPEVEAYTFTINIDGKEESFTLKDGESKTFENLPYGTAYSVVEEAGEKASWNVKAPADGKAEGTISQDSTNVDFVNRYEYAEAQDMAVFSAVKQSSKDSKALSGAEFTVYSDKDCTKSVATAKTDANGKMGFGFKSEGTFYMKETKAPTGYVCSDKVVELAVAVKQYTVARLENEDKSVTTAIVPVLQLTVKGAKLLSGSDSVFQLTNDPETYIDITVTAVWKNDKETGTRPEKVTITLYKDGTKYESKTVTEKDKWTCTWTNLPSQYKWTVDESGLPAGYTKSVSQKNNTFTITNTYSSIPKTGDESAPILWALLAMATAAGAVLTVRKLRKENG